MTSLPAWIEKDAWDGFVVMRRAIKKPMTDRAERLIIKALYELKDKGHDPNLALDQSTLCNWQMVFPPKVSEIPNLARTYMTTLDGPMTQEQKEASDKARRLAMSSLRRVA